MLDSCKMVQKAAWSIPYVSVAFFPSLKQNFIAYRSSKVSSRPDCIFEIHQWWQSGFSRVYSNCCCSCLFEPEIIKIGQSSHKMYSNNILNFQESTTTLNARTKKSGNLLNTPRIYTYVCVHSFSATAISMRFSHAPRKKAPWKSSSSLLYSQRFARCVLWLSSGVSCSTRVPTQNFEPNS